MQQRLTNPVNQKEDDDKSYTGERFEAFSDLEKNRAAISTLRTNNS